MNVTNRNRPLRSESRTSNAEDDAEIGSDQIEENRNARRLAGQGHE